jgi:hypothetical protein
MIETHRELVVIIFARCTRSHTGSDGFSYAVLRHGIRIHNHK